MRTRAFIIVVLLQLTVTTQVAKAQYSDYYYHRVGDTVEWDTRIGYYSWWEWEYFFQNNLMVYSASESTDWSHMWENSEDSAIQLQYFYTPVPLKIIGIAGSCVRGHVETIPEFSLDTNEAEEYLYIYEAGPGNAFTQLTATRWSPFDPKRYIHVVVHHDYHRRDSCCTYNPYDQYIPISEYYFDSAIWVTDSFYVGGSYFGCITPSYGGPQNHLVTQYRAAAMNGVNQSCDPEHQISGGPDNHCMFPSIKRKRRTCDQSHLPHTSFTENGWRWFDNNTGSAIIYPIIEVDTTVPPEWACDSVQNVQVTVSGTSATVTWDGFPNYSRMLLRYGLRHEPQSQWREVDVTGSTLHTLTNLSPSFIYGVMLKAECDISKKETPWSRPQYFYVPTDTTGGGTQGIDEGTTTLSRLTFLQPNPARDEVRVTSSFNLTAIDLWTVDGVMVYHGGWSGHEATVDVSWLRAGTYIVAIHTHNGTTHKRLLIY
ncbi:MAG: fibronectin type III domain-containing protein [Bacteroidales bacterium]|nr:fibronectin type III domain-containing protein [Bacteroidales bacterium]